MDDHEFTKDDLEIVKWMIFVLKLSETNACILHESVDRTSYGQFDALDRGVTKKRKVGEINQSIQTGLRVTGNFCHVGDRASECKLGLFPDADFVGDLTDFQVNIRWNALYRW